ncbi:MAG: hypothetical protein N3D74_05040 [Caldisericia bacterium]|nr:hypothetical protein [Caldisericia bacterium]
MNSIFLRKLIKKFNSMRYPECKAKTIKNSKDELIIEFSGTVASYSCCFDEHFNDLKYFFEDNGNIKLYIDNVKRKDNEKFIVKYKYKQN